MINNNLNRYDFIEGQMFIPKSYGVIVSPEDNIISVTGDGSLLGVVKLDVTKNTISLIGKNGRKFSSAKLPLVDVISDAYYDEETTSLIIKVILSDGSEKQISVPFNDLLNDYAKKTDVDKNSSAITKINEDIIELSKNLANEINDRTEADSELIIIIQEVSEKVKGYEDGLKAEEQSRIDGDNEVKQIIEDKIEEVERLISNESSVRAEADKELSDKISTIESELAQEKSDRAKADDDLTKLINDEKSERVDVDNEIKESIENLKNSVEISINEVSGNLMKESEERKAKDEELSLAISQESDRAKTEEAKLQEQITGITSSTGLADEIKARIEADEQLSKRIDDLHQNTDGEIVDIKKLIETVDGKIQEEAHQRIENDNVLQSAIEKEINDRTEADKSIESKIDELDGKSVKWTDVHTEDNPNRKSVVLENYDTILGKDTKGSAYNLVMLSKWDVADFGSASVNINLNGKGERPTYNDSKGLALMEDIANMSKSIKLIKNTDLNYSLMVGETNVGSIIIPKDQFLKSVSYESETKEIVFVFETTEGESTIRIELNELVDAYKAGLGLGMENNTFNVLIDKTSETNQYLFITEHGLKLNGIDEKFAQYTPTESLNEDFATKAELSQESDRAKTEEAKLLGTNADAEDIMSLYGVKKFAEKVKREEITNINLQIENINGKFGDYITKEESVVLHDNVLKEAEQYTDTKISDERQSIVVESVNSSKEYTDGKVSDLSKTIEGNTNRVTAVEERCDHYDDLFTMILDEHGDPIKLNFYTKAETDDKLNVIKDSVKLVSDKLELKVDKVEGSSLMTSDEKTKLQGLKNINIDTKERHLVLDENNNLSFKYQFKKTAPYLYQFLDKDGRQVANVDNIDFTSDFESILSMVRQKAWQVHLDKANAKISALEASIAILNDKIDKLSKTNVEVQEAQGNALNLNDTTKDYIVKGDLTEKSNIKAKSIVMDNVSISNNARVLVDANDVVFNGSNISGDFPKKDGNAVVVINNAEYVTFKNMTINSNNIYNAIEIGYGEKNVLPKNVLFENCKFEGKFSNNTILIFGTQDNATITLSNCTFPNVSNVLRLSNKTNANGVVVNVNNCKVEQWDVNTPWQGFLICEDYTSKTVEEAETNNLYGDGKIVVNFVNLFHKNEKVMPSNVAEVCGSKNEKQVVIVCIDAIQQDDYCLNYIPNRFPVVKFS